MKRFQARRAGGQFTRNTTLNTWNLRTAVCRDCGAINAYGRKELPARKPGETLDPALFNAWDKPTHCSGCGKEL